MQECVAASTSVGMISLEVTRLCGRTDMSQQDVTIALGALAAGEAGARDTLLQLVYEELRKLAESRMRQESPGQTLQATALVHEAYLRLVGEDAAKWESRAHFFHAAAEAMRRILIERARRRKRLKHGGGRLRFDVDDAAQAEAAVTDEADPAQMLALDEALERLQREDARLAQVVMLRFFGGLSVERVAEVLGVSDRTVKRDWEFARAWLLKEMRGVGAQHE